MADQAVTTSGVVRHGRLKIRNAERLTRDLRRWTKDTEVVITIERKHATRSLQANALYWAVYVETLSEYTGFTPDEMHEWLKQTFLPKKRAVCDGNGEIVGELVIGGTTTSLNNLEFSDYLRNIKMWALDKLNVVIPEPEDR